MSVTVKGTKVATSTNNEGRNTINVPQGNSTLVFSSVGLRPQEVNITGRTTIDVTMTEEAAAMTDVVAVGYSTVRRRDLTGSVSSVGARQLRDYYHQCRRSPNRKTGWCTGYYV